MAVDTPVRAVLVVMLLLSVCLEMVVGIVLVQECEVNVVVVAGGEQFTFTKERSNTDRSQMNLYGKVEDGFEGFTVSVEGTGGIGYSAWFPADEECFRDKHSWHQFRIFTLIRNNINTTILFGFETRYCRKECERVPAPRSLQQQSVEVHGASRWSGDYPQSQCEVARPLGQSFHGKHPTCSKRPTSMSTMTKVVIVIVLVGVSMLLVLAVYLGKKLIKSRSAPSGTHTEGHSAKERLSRFLLMFWRRQQDSLTYTSSDDPANTRVPLDNLCGRPVRGATHSVPAVATPPETWHSVDGRITSHL